MNLKHGSTPWVFIFLLQWLWAGCALAQLPDAVQRVKPSVVLVGTYKATDNPPNGHGNVMSETEFCQEQPSIRDHGQRIGQKGLGHITA